MRILVTDDSAFMRRALTQILSSNPSFEVVGTAQNGQDALDKIRALKPDLVTLDVEMPVMDGLTTLRELRLTIPEPRPAVLMCSSLTTQGSHEAIRALRLGASDVIAKDAAVLAGKLDDFRHELLAKAEAVLETRKNYRGAKPPPATSVPRRVADLSPGSIDLVLIGSSTGGPPVVEKILTSLPAEYPVPVVVAQHMPALFTKSLSQRLDETCAVSVLHGSSNEILLPGTVTVIEGGKHGRVHAHSGGPARFKLEVSPEPTTAPYRPSVDELFHSAAVAAGGRCLAVVLTGMGDDGSRGAAAIASKGGIVLTQEASTCVVYGMPKAAVENGASACSLSPEALAETLAKVGSVRGPLRIPGMSPKR